MKNDRLSIIVAISVLSLFIVGIVIASNYEMIENYINEEVLVEVNGEQELPFILLSIDHDDNATLLYTGYAEDDKYPRSEIPDVLETIKRGWYNIRGIRLMTYTEARNMGLNENEENSISDSFILGDGFPLEYNEEEKISYIVNNKGKIVMRSYNDINIYSVKPVIVIDRKYVKKSK